MPAKSGAYMVLSKVDLSGISELQVQAMAPKPQVNALGGKIELRLDSPKGKLVGESAFLEPSEQMSMNPNILKVPIGKVEGLHDIYVVFVNPKAENGTLMIVTGLEFKLND